MEVFADVNQFSVEFAFGFEFLEFAFEYAARDYAEFRLGSQTFAPKI